MALLTITLTGEYERLEPYVQALRYALDVREEQTEAGEAGIVKKTLTVESHCSRVNNITISVESYHIDAVS